MQMAEQVTINQEAWASHAALDARVSKLEQRLSAISQQALKGSSGNGVAAGAVAAAIDKRLGKRR